MKRFDFKWVVVLVLIIVSLFAAVSTKAESQGNALTSGNFVYEVKPNGTATILGYLGGNQSDIILPNLVDGYTITAIGDNAFNKVMRSGDSITVTLPETIKSIGEQAFAYRNIRSINLPDGLEYIGAGAFVQNPSCKFRISSDHPKYAVIDGSLYDKENKSLIAGIVKEDGTLSIPKGIVSIADMACYEMFDIKNENRDYVEVSLPATLKHIGDWAFTQTILKIKDDEWSGFFPEGLETIGEGAFAATRFRGISLKNPIVFPKSLIKIGARAFEERHPWHQNTDKYYTFEGNTKLKEIQDKTFYCSKENKNGNYILNLGEIEVIGESAFEDAILYCELSEGIKQIGKRSFAGARIYIEGDFVIPGTCETISEEAFCETRISTPRSIKNEEKHVVLEEGIKRIESKSLLLENINSIFLPASVSYIASGSLSIEHEYNAPSGSYAARWLSENAYLYEGDFEENQDLGWLD